MNKKMRMISDEEKEKFERRQEIRKSLEKLEQERTRLVRLYAEKGLKGLNKTINSLIRTIDELRDYEKHNIGEEL